MKTSKNFWKYLFIFKTAFILINIEDNSNNI